MSIQIKIAFCTECNGYHSATPSDQKNYNHTDIIDHFFYHGEPWFTLDPATFEHATSLENTEVRTINLDEHVMQDHLYCHCEKKTASTKNKYDYQSIEPVSAIAAAEKYNDIEYYFSDLYYTYNTFHGLAM